MRQNLIISLTTLFFALSAMPSYADMFIENAIRECVKYEFDKKKDKYTTVTEMQASRKSINRSCTRSVGSACKDHNSQYCVSLLDRYHGKEPKRRSNYSAKKNEQVKVIRENKTKTKSRSYYPAKKNEQVKVIHDNEEKKVVRSKN